MTAVASPASDFIFDSAATTPYASAPSSPRGIDAYSMSVPTSPSRSFHGHSSSSVPFFWEESPGTPKHGHHHPNSDDPIESTFEFCSGHLPTDTDPATADELFDGGIIRPLKPPPRLHVVAASAATVRTYSPKSPRSPKALFRSPKSHLKPDDFDPFEKAIEEATRGRATAPAAGGGGRRAARSLSPLRGVFGFHGKSGAVTGGDEITSVSGGSWKSKLKELFLFRSKSEGRVTGNRSRDVLRKYTAGPRISSGTAAVEDTRNSSFRSTDSFGSVRRGVARDGGGSVGGGSSRRRGVSPHEMHYTAKRAVSEEQKKKTFLPYRQGLLSCLGFSSVLPIHDLSKSFGSFAPNRS